MRTVTINLEEDDNTAEAAREHDLECIMTLNGRYYHNCLRDVCRILIEFDKGKRLTKEQKKLLADIRDQCAEYFRSIYHDKQK